ncbi:heat shock factor protein 1 isoform X1 [Nilaparvata lugens]|uniref:heat shock factor protein 1 isoform X1 n=1 Tax=Nilaparvata lugens TaxID=108931 RepID=UPI00193C9FD5|nr:heat shock factor protein 1 isoform X1 [Nilaparvata lugens]
MYYKHNNMASFIRQLNMYGFHKNLSLESGCAKMEDVVIEFYHPCFQKNNPNLLQNIKRKMNARGGTAGGGSGGGAVSASPDPMLVSQLLLDVKRMKSRQDSVDSRFNQLKMENEALWREVAIMRQKHIKQQQIVNKLIQFLLTVVQHPSNGFSVKRRGLPLMLQDHSVPSNQLNKNNQSLSEVSRSPTGPVIHEIDPNEYAASLLLNDVQSASQQTPDQQVNDQTITTDATATTTADELLDLPNQLLAEQLSADGDEQTEQLFARPKQIRPGKRRPRKPAATKKLPSKVADVCPGQPDIDGLDLDDFPLIINGSQALEQLTNLPTSSNDGLLPSDNDANIEALTTPITNLTADSSIANLTTDTPIISLSADSPITNLTADVPIISLSADSPITNLTADAPIISLTADSPVTNLTADAPIISLTADSSPISNLTADSPVPIVIPASPYSADLADIVDNSQQPIVNCQQSIVNSTVPIVAADKSRYKKMAPKLVIPSQQSQMKVIRPQRKRKTAVAAQTKSGGKRSKADGGKFKSVSATVARQPETTPANQNSDRTVACMAPTNSQQSMKFARNQDFNNTLFKSQEIDNHVDTIQNDLDTLKELLKGESISLDANTLLGKLSSSTLSQYLTFNKNEDYEFDKTSDSVSE